MRFCFERVLLSLYFWRKKKKRYGVFHVGIHGGIIEATEYVKKNEDADLDSEIYCGASGT